MRNRIAEEVRFKRLLLVGWAAGLLNMEVPCWKDSWRVDGELDILGRLLVGRSQQGGLRREFTIFLGQFRLYDQFLDHGPFISIF